MATNLAIDDNLLNEAENRLKKKSMESPLLSKSL